MFLVVMIASLAPLKYEEFASDLLPAGTIVFTDSEENEETMRSYGVTQEIRQSGKGRVRCDHNVAVICRDVDRRSR